MQAMRYAKRNRYDSKSSVVHKSSCEGSRDRQAAYRLHPRFNFAAGSFRSGYRSPKGDPSPHDNVGQYIPAGSNGRRQRSHTLDCRDRPSSKNIRNHRPIVAAPVPPHIAAPVPLGSATQTAGAVTVTSIAVTRSPTEAAANVIVRRTIASATATMSAASGKCAGGKPGTSESKENCKNNDGIAQHWRPLRDAPASASIQGP
jgi:hypothetical protein